MNQPNPAPPSPKTGEDMLVGLCGFITSLITAIILWWVDTRFGVALYSWMFWFIVPVGALLAGFAGASGYFAGSWFFDHRPTPLLLMNVVLASLGAFFTIHYLTYITLEIEGKTVSDYISFVQYMDITYTSQSMEFMLRGAKIGTTGELGNLGYGVAILQILGFAVGGFAVFVYLASMPYCDKCSRYLSGKGKQVRYSADAEGFKTTTIQVLDNFGSDNIASAIEHHHAFGNSKHQKGDFLRSTIEVKNCPKCRQHWGKFMVEKFSGNDWKEINDLTISRFTEQLVNF